MSGPYVAGWIQHSPLRQHIRPTGEAKRRFDTAEEARAFAASLNPPNTAYRCGVCGCWHVGRRKAK